MQSPLDVRPHVAAALADHRPVVALESTLITHGLPAPANLETALELEEAVRAGDAVPATIAILAGTLTVGLSEAEIRALTEEERVAKVSRRDLAAAVAGGGFGATTVAATLWVAARAGIRLIFFTSEISLVRDRK